MRSFPRAADHRWQHTLNVVANAEEILLGEGADEETVSVMRVAALMHDISMFTCDHSIHGRVSAEMASEYLLEHEFSPDFVSRVSTAIAEHGTDFGDLPSSEQGEQFSWEGKVLIEADILDKLGASAVTNGLMYLGKQEKLNFEAREELLSSSSYDRADFFKDYFWTETGRKMAKRRFSFLKSIWIGFKRKLSSLICLIGKVDGSPTIRWSPGRTPGSSPVKLDEWSSSDPRFSRIYLEMGYDRS